MRRALILLCVLLLATPAIAKTLYVDGSDAGCSDSTTYANNGVGSPWCTVGRSFWGSTNQASPNTSEAPQPGDTVIVSGGTYTTDRTKVSSRDIATLVPANNGTSGSRIVYQASGTVNIRQTGNAGPIVESGSYVTIDGFTFNETYATPRDDTGLVISWNETGSIIKNCKFIGTYITPSNNRTAIRLNGTVDAHVYNNEISGFTGNDTDNTGGIILYSVQNTIVEHNYFHDNNVDVHPKGSDGINLETITIRYNLFSGSGKAIRVVYLDDSNVYQNLMVGATIYSVEYNTGPHNVKVVNNTVVMSGSGSCARVSAMEDGSKTGNIFANNICYDPSAGVNAGVLTRTDAFNTIDRNVYYSPTEWSYNGSAYTTIANWRTATPWDDNSITDNPLFVDAANGNYKLQGASPALTIGVDILDLDGDSSTIDTVPAGAYITGNEVIGINNGVIGGRMSGGGAISSGGYMR